MAEQPRPVSLGPRDGTSIPNPLGGPVTLKVRGAETAGALLAFESLPDAGEGPPRHTHAEQDEVLYVLDGEFRFKLDDELTSAPAGSFVFIPRGRPHAWQNVGSETGRLLVILMPAGRFEEFFEQFSKFDEPDPAAFAKLGEDVGMEVVGPPLAVSDPL
jgi:quercetin dioxygenase-like cupin family protein